jgi:hypothetical protein
MTLPEWQGRHHSPHMTATRPVANARKPWTDADDDALRHLAGTNTRAKLIADQLGRSLASVQARANQLGILVSESGRRRSTKTGPWQVMAVCGAPYAEGLNVSQEEPETPLAMARRHVAEAEERVARQRKILAEMQADNQPAAAHAAQRVLATMERTLATLREHLRLEEQR